MKISPHFKYGTVVLGVILVVSFGRGLLAEQTPELNEDLPTPSLGSIEPQSGKAVLTWQKSAASDVPKVKVDAGGKGDVMSIREALELATEGTIVVAAGTYSEAPFTIPNGVTLQGGYDADSWQWDPVNNVTILQAAQAAPTFISLGNASSLRGFRISNSGRCVENNFTGALVSNNTFQGCDEGVLVAMQSETTIANNTFLSGRIGVHLKDQARVVLKDNVMTGLAQGIWDERELATGDEISDNASYGNQKGDAGDAEDLGLTNKSAFPPDSGPARTVGPWALSLEQDDKEQDQTSKSFSDEPFTAIYLAYSLGAGDRLTIHARDHYDQLIFDSLSLASEDPGSWHAVPETGEIVLRLRTNGDGKMGKTKDGFAQNWAQITQLGEYALPDFSLPVPSTGSEGQTLGAEGVGTASSAKISLTRTPENLPEFDTIQKEEETVSYLEGEILDKIGSKKIILNGENWVDLESWTELFSEGQEYSSRAPYEVTDGRTINAMLSALFANSSGQVNRLLVKEKTYEPAPNNFDGDLVKAEDAGYFLTNLTDWLKNKIDSFCPSEDEECEPNANYKYFVKPLTQLGKTDCVEVRDCPLGPLYEGPLEEQPYVALLNRPDLYNHTGDFGGEGLDSPTEIDFKNLSGGEGVVQGTGPGAGYKISSSPGSEDEEIPGGGAFLNVLLKEASAAGKLKFRVTGTNPEFGKRSIAVIRDDDYYPAPEKSPNAVWRNFIDMRKYTGTLMRLKWATEDTYVIEAWGSVPDWDYGKWYEITIGWGDGRIIMKREVLDGTGKVLGQDLAGEESPETGDRAGNDWSSALTWEYPGKVTADSFLIGGKEYAASVQGIYNDIRIFSTPKALKSEVFVNHDRKGAGEPIIFDSAELRADPRPAGLLSAGEVYVYLEKPAEMTDLIDISEGGKSKLRLSRKILAGKNQLVLFLGDENTPVAQTLFPSNWRDGGRLELQWFYNPASDKTFFAVYGENTNAEEVLLLANTGVYGGKAYQGSFLLSDPVIKISQARQGGSAMIGPAKAVLRYTGEMPSTTDTPKTAVGYRIYYGKNEAEVLGRSSDSQFVSQKELENPEAPEYTLTGLDNKERYYVALATVDQEGRESLLSQTMSFVASPEQDFMPPDPRPTRIDQDMQDTAREEQSQTADVRLVPQAYATEQETEQQELGALLKIPLGESLQLDGSLSQDDGGEKLQYQWSLGTSPATSEEDAPEKAYVYPGTYLAKRELVDDEGAYREIYSEPIKILPSTDEWVQPSMEVWTVPVEQETWKGMSEAKSLETRKPALPAVDEPLYFTGKVLDISGSSIMELQRIEWDFGDGTIEKWEAGSTDSPEQNKAWRATHAVLQFGDSLEPEPIKHIYEQAGGKIASLCVEDLSGHESCYQYTICAEPVQILPAQAKLSSAGTGALEAVGGRAPYHWYLNGTEVVTEDEQGKVFLNLSPGDKVMVKDSFAVSVPKEEEGVSDNSAELLIEQAEEGQKIISLNKVPRGTISFVREKPEKIPAVIKFSLQAEDEDGYLATLKPWKFGDALPAFFAKRLPANNASSSLGEEASLTTGTFDFLGDYPLVLTAQDAKGNSAVSVIKVRVVPPEMYLDGEGAAALGVTTGAVRKVELLQRTATGDFALFGEMQPDSNGVFISRVNDPGLAGKQGWELREAGKVLVRALADYSFQLAAGVKTKANYSTDTLSVDFYQGDKRLGGVSYRGDANQDLSREEKFDPAKQVPQIRLAEGAELNYRNNESVLSLNGKEQLVYKNSGGLLLKEGISISSSVQNLPGTSLQKISLSIKDGATEIATIYPQSPSALLAEQLSVGADGKWQEVQFSSTGLVTDQAFYVAIYDKAGKRYQYPAPAKLTKLDSFSQNSFGLATDSQSAFFAVTETPSISNQYPSFFGVVDPNSIVDISVHSSQEQNYHLQSDSRGAFSQVLTKPLGEGEHEVTFSWNGQSQSYEFEVDLSAPATPILSGLQAGRILFGKTEPGAYVAGYSYGLLEEIASTQADASGNFQLTFSDNSLKYRVLSYDQALNFSPAVTQEFVSENTGEEVYSVTENIPASSNAKLKWGLGLVALAVLGLAWIRKRRTSL